jgi:GNAT superfamily N-acetyltransferase
MALAEILPRGITLRKATGADLPFLFRVSTEAMRPVTEMLNPGKAGNEEEKLARYAEKFDPEKIDVIRYEGEDVGRLRVVRSPESIYIGGIQILPEFQGKGIGTSLMHDLIRESETSGIPILLEVHDVNARAMAFYANLGFKEGEKVGNQTIMTYSPGTQKS